MEFGVVRLGQVGVICFCSKALQGVHSFCFSWIVGYARVTVGFIESFILFRVFVCTALGSYL